MKAAAGRLATYRGLAVLACLACSPSWAELDLPQALAEAPMAMEGKATGALSLNLSSPVGTPPGQGGAKPLDLGLQWRQPLAHQQHVDITAWRRVSEPPDALTLIRNRDPVYGARVEMQLRPSKTRFVVTHRFVGLRLDSGDRIIFRRKNGNSTLYYRADF